MNFLKGLIGAGTGFLTGGPGGAALGGVAGLTGTNPHEDPVMKQQRMFQQGIANQMLGYANSAPGSSPDELANFAQSRGMLGQSQRQQQNRVMGAWNPNQGTSPTGLLQNLTNSNIAQQMAQHSSFLQDAAANRRQALLNAANLGQGAASLYRPQQAQFPQMAGQLAQMLAYRNAQKQQQGSNADANTIMRQGPAVFGGGGIAGNGEPPPPPAGWQTQGAADPSQFHAVDPSQLQALFTQMGWSPVDGAPGMQGAQAPGNSPGGMNATNNQIRQSNGFSTPMAGGIPGGPNMMMLNMLGRQLMLPGGIRLPY